MHNSKLVHLFKNLTSSEIKRLLYFLKSPFYNANPNLVKLYKLLRAAYPDFTAQKLAKEKVFKKLFPKREYDHQKLLNLMSDLSSLVKKYLQVLQLEEQEQVQQQLLLEAYAKRPLCYDTFLNELRKVERLLDTSPYRNAAFYRQKYYLKQLYLNHPKTDKFQLSKAQYDHVMEQLDRCFQLEKLLLSCEMKAREKPLSETYDIWMLEEVKEGIAYYPVERPIERAYVEMLNLLEKDSTVSYFKLKELFLNHSAQLTPQQQKDILQSLVNFTIRRGNQGDQDFLKENLELYQVGLREKILLEQDLLNDMTYLSIVNIGLRTGAYDWCLEFIDTYEIYLEAGTQKDAKALATALWFYAAKKPDETIALLQKVEFLNVYYQVQARVLLIKIYFENLRADDTYFDLVHAQSESFERYLRRNKKVAKTQKKALLNFCTLIRRMTKLEIDQNLRSKTNLSKLRSDIQTMNSVYNKSWILQQIDLRGKHDVN